MKTLTKYDTGYMIPDTGCLILDENFIALECYPVSGIQYPV